MGQHITADTLAAFTIVASFLGAVLGGLGATVLANLYNRRVREALFLREQLGKLYGPLEFYASQNEVYFQRADKLLAAGEDEYSGRAVHESEHEGMDELFAIYNEYIRDAKANNAKLMDILRDNYAYADTDDTGVLIAFAEDYSRLHTEMKPEGGTRLPLHVQLKMDAISFMRAEFIQRVHSKFLSKQKRLRQLGG